MTLGKYNKKKGSGIVGVHSPEFKFEKNYANVNDAVQRFGITRPAMAGEMVESQL
jgi:hypothetical protein